MPGLILKSSIIKISILLMASLCLLQGYSLGEDVGEIQSVYFPFYLFNHSYDDYGYVYQKSAVLLTNLDKDNPVAVTLIWRDKEGNLFRKDVTIPKGATCNSLDDFPDITRENINTVKPLDPLTGTSFSLEIQTGSMSLIRAMVITRVYSKRDEDFGKIVSSYSEDSILSPQAEVSPGMEIVQVEAFDRNQFYYHGAKEGAGNFQNSVARILNVTDNDATITLAWKDEHDNEYAKEVVIPARGHYDTGGVFPAVTKDNIDNPELPDPLTGRNLTLTIKSGQPCFVANTITNVYDRKDENFGKMLFARSYLSFKDMAVAVREVPPPEEEGDVPQEESSEPPDNMPASEPLDTQTAMASDVDFQGAPLLKSKTGTAGSVMLSGEAAGPSAADGVMQSVPEVSSPSPAAQIRQKAEDAAKINAEAKKDTAAAAAAAKSPGKEPDSLKFKPAPVLVVAKFQKLNTFNGYFSAGDAAGNGETVTLSVAEKPSWIGAENIVIKSGNPASLDIVNAQAGYAERDTDYKLKLKAVNVKGEEAYLDVNVRVLSR